VFLTLDDVILPPPLGVVVGVFLAMGIWALGDGVVRQFDRQGSAIARGAGFVTAAAALGAVTHAMAWIGWRLGLGLRLLGVVLVFAGIWQGWTLARAMWSRRSSVGWARRDGLERWLGVLGIVVVVGLLLSALGPPTDADSLDYHLGVPLDWLRHGSAFPRSDWMSARLVGLGECLNLLGLAVGCEQLGALLQAAGLLALVAAFAEWSTRAGNRALGVLWVAAPPVLAFLVPNQKPMLLPIAGTTIGLLAVVQAEAVGGFELAVASVAIAFAVACKSSFVLTGGFAAVVMLAAAKRGGRLPLAMALLGGAMGLIAGPQLARNVAFYGDPFPPFLAPLQAHADPLVLHFARFLREFGGVLTWKNALLLPVQLLLPSHLGQLSTVLGPAAVALLLLPSTGRRMRWLAAASVGAAVATAALGQLSPRFFLEPYLWGGAAILVRDLGRWRKGLAGLLAVQGALAAAMAWFGAVTLAPGSLNHGLREAVMTRAAQGFAETRWIDRELPAGTVILTDARSRALLPRPFVVDDLSRYGLPAEEARARFENLVVEHHVGALVVPRAGCLESGTIAEQCAQRVIGPALFQIATRNPYNHGAPEAREIVQINTACRPAPER
jgi:hypothetical protein